jgi:hypothetical protein
LPENRREDLCDSSNDAKNERNIALSAIDDFGCKGNVNGIDDRNE